MLTLWQFEIIGKLREGWLLKRSTYFEDELPTLCHPFNKMLNCEVQHSDFIDLLISGYLVFEEEKSNLIVNVYTTNKEIE